MIHTAEIAEIKKLVSQGKLEQALPRLLAILENEPGFEEEAGIARVNQADWFQLKSKVLKGTIDSEAERIATNQITDTVLQLIKRLENPRTAQPEPGKKQSWKRLGIFGSLAVIAVIAIVALLRQKNNGPQCPQYGEGKSMKVMVLPFRAASPGANLEPEIGIVAGLNNLIEANAKLMAIAEADVHEQYNIKANFPNPSEAENIARQCGVQMIVWGRARPDNNLDVQCRLLDARHVQYTAKADVNDLLTVTSQGSIARDEQSTVRLLFMMLVNQLQIAMTDTELAALMPEKQAPNAPVDTVESLLMADIYLNQDKPEKAIEEYDKILQEFPTQATALKKRGALLFNQGQYEKAAADLEAAQSHNVAENPALQKARILAFLKNNQPDKAEQEVRKFKPASEADRAWTQDVQQQIQQSRSELEKKLESLNKSKTSRSLLDAAKASYNLGKEKEALEKANDVLDRNPANKDALKIVVETHLEKGNTAPAVEALKNAKARGVDLNAIDWKPAVKQTLKEKMGGMLE